MFSSKIVDKITKNFTRKTRLKQKKDIINNF